MALLQKAYLGATPLFRNEDWFEDDARRTVSPAAGASAVNVTANTAAHTKGAWAQLIGSTASNASLLVCSVANIATSNTDTATLIDIGTGSAGSETVVAGDIAVGGASTATGGYRAGCFFLIPLKIPSGTRIAARIQSVVTGGKVGQVFAFAVNAGDYDTAPTSVDVIGTNTATSKGTEFSGASGSWNEAVASTSQAYRAVGVVVSIHDANMSVTGGTRDFSIGVGASGSEVEFGNLRYENNTAETSSLMPPYSQLFGRAIPAGSRLAVKHNFASDPNKFGFCLIGIP
jgi:hypothetical protein